MRIKIGCLKKIKMHQIQGIRRDLVFETTLEEQIEEENPVRFIDVFVEGIKRSYVMYETNLQWTKYF